MAASHPWCTLAYGIQRCLHLADALSMLGKSYRADQNYQQAEPILDRALQIYESIPLGDSSEAGRVKLHGGEESETS